MSVNTNTKEDFIEPAGLVEDAETRTSPAEDEHVPEGLEEETVPNKETFSAFTRLQPVLTSSALAPAHNTIHNN